MSRSKKAKKAKKMKLIIGAVVIFAIASGVIFFLDKNKKGPEEPIPDTSYNDKEVYPGQDEREGKSDYEVKEKITEELSAEDLEDTDETEVTEAKSLDETTPVSEKGYLEVHFIDVGQGDSIFVSYVDYDLSDGDDSASMLVDAGDNTKGTLVRNYISKHGGKELDYFVCTHPDADHIGGAASVVSNVDIKSGIVWAPDFAKDTKSYDNLINEINNKWYSYEMPALFEEHSLGEASFTFLAPSKAHSDANNNSLVMKLWLGDDSFLLMGDCEDEEELELTSEISSSDLTADVLKVGHHGSKTSTSETLLSMVNPSYAVISCGEGNTYGHPHAAALNNLRSAGCELFRTDVQGSIVAKTYGNGIEWNASPCNDWASGE